MEVGRGGEERKKNVGCVLQGKLEEREIPFLAELLLVG